MRRRRWLPILQFAEASEGASDDTLIDSGDDRMGAESDEIVESAEAEITDADARIHLGQWLVMAESQVFSGVIPGRLCF